MSSPLYVREKLQIALLCMCDDAPFAERLKSAALGLHMLKDDDLDGDAAVELKLVLDWTKRNLLDGQIQRIPEDEERQALIEAMVSLLCHTCVE